MKKKMTVLGGLLMAVAITGYSVSGTYAKYISSIDVTDDARVAKWNIDFKDAKDVKIDTTKKIDLFQESYTLERECKEGETANGTVDATKCKYTYVQSSENGTKVLAPGTKGEYTFNIKGTTETNYKLSVGLAKTTDGSAVDTTKSYNHAVLTTAVDGVDYDPILFSVDGGNTWFKFADLETKLANLAAISGKVFAAGTVNQTITIQWKWDFNSTNNVNDVNDTKLGNKAAAGTDTKIVLDLVVTAEQTMDDVTA